MSPLKQALLPIPDPRRAQGKLYDLPHMLLFSILAVMSGATSYRRIHQFMRTHQARLNEAFGCRWRRTPAYSSIRHALRGLHCGRVATHFQSHAAGLIWDSAVIALDGKALRGSLDRFEDARACAASSRARNRSSTTSRPGRRRHPPWHRPSAATGPSRVCRRHTERRFGKSRRTV